MMPEITSSTLRTESLTNAQSASTASPPVSKGAVQDTLSRAHSAPSALGAVSPTLAALSVPAGQASSAATSLPVSTTAAVVASDDAAKGAEKAKTPSRMSRMRSAAAAQFRGLKAACWGALKSVGSTLAAGAQGVASTLGAFAGSCKRAAAKVFDAVTFGPARRARSLRRDAANHLKRQEKLVSHPLSRSPSFDALCDDGPVSHPLSLEDLAE